MQIALKVDSAIRELGKRCDFSSKKTIFIQNGFLLTISDVKGLRNKGIIVKGSWLNLTGLGKCILIQLTIPKQVRAGIYFLSLSDKNPNLISFKMIQSELKFVVPLLKQVNVFERVKVNHEFQNSFE